MFGQIAMKVPNLHLTQKAKTELLKRLTAAGGECAATALFGSVGEATLRADLSGMDVKYLAARWMVSTIDLKAAGRTAVEIDQVPFVFLNEGDARRLEGALIDYVEDDFKVSWYE